MIQSDIAEPTLLKEEGKGRVEIWEETTPGNLYSFCLKGLQRFPSVRVHVYKRLPDHKAWPKVTNTMQFYMKGRNQWCSWTARIMRLCRPVEELSSAHFKAWKDILALKFRANVCIFMPYHYEDIQTLTKGYHFVCHPVTELSWGCCFMPTCQSVLLSATLIYKRSTVHVWYKYILGQTVWDSIVVINLGT